MSGRILIVAAMLAGMFLPAVAQQAQNNQPQLPDGPGKDVVQSVCSTCHSLNRFIHTGYTPKGWQTVIAMMRNVGAPLTPDQVPVVTAYLTKNYPEPADTPKPVVMRARSR